MRDKHREFLRKIKEGTPGLRSQRGDNRSEASDLQDGSAPDLQQEIYQKFNELFGPVEDDQGPGTG